MLLMFLLMTYPVIGAFVVSAIVQVVDVTVKDAIAAAADSKDTLAIRFNILPHSDMTYLY